MNLLTRKLILFIVSCGLFLIITGTLLLIIYNFYQAEYKDVRPAIVIGKILRNLASTTGAGAAKLIFSGPVLLAGGFMTLLFSLEVCIRLYKETKREADPDLDNLTNPHEVKHWMDPKIIPYGWGLFGEQDEIIVIQTGIYNDFPLYSILLLCLCFQKRKWRSPLHNENLFKT